MTRKIIQWAYQDVTDFLKEHDFSFSETVNGSYESWIKFKKNVEPDRIVEVKFSHGHYGKKALQRMINQSGIPKEKWIEWACS